MKSKCTKKYKNKTGYKTAKQKKIDRAKNTLSKKASDYRGKLK